MGVRKNISLDFRKGIERAYARIQSEIIRTALENSPGLSLVSGARTYLKWENKQRTGSFKFRGALNKLRSLSPEDRDKGVVSASTGNHGLGLSLAARMEGVGLVLVLPMNVCIEKRRRLEESGAEIILHGESCDRAEHWARHLAEESGRVYVSPYNDPEVIFGQGTIGLEILQDLAATEAALVPVGGGGLVAGIAGYLKSVNNRISVFGVEPERSAFMAASLCAGKIVKIREEETIAEAVAGGIEPGSITFPLCQALLDGLIKVGESLIWEAMCLLYDKHGQTVEGAGALALAGMLDQSGLLSRKRTVLIVSGGNISTESFREAVSGP
jgi:threonine dehydratase